MDNSFLSLESAEQRYLTFGVAVVKHRRLICISIFYTFRQYYSSEKAQVVARRLKHYVGPFPFIVNGTTIVTL